MKHLNLYWFVYASVDNFGVSSNKEAECPVNSEQYFSAHSLQHSLVSSLAILYFSCTKLGCPCKNSPSFPLKAKL